MGADSLRLVPQQQSAYGRLQVLQMVELPGTARLVVVRRLLLAHIMAEVVISFVLFER